MLINIALKFHAKMATRFDFILCCVGAGSD